MNIANIFSKKLIVPAILLVILVLLATLPFFGPTYLTILMISLLMYAVVTVSWAMFSGPTGYVSLAAAAFYGVGIYTSAVLGKMLPLFLIVILGGVISFCLGLLVGALTLRLRGVYFTIFTFGLVQLIQRILLWYEMSLTHTRGRFVVLVDNNTIYFYILAIFAILMITVYLIQRSKWGLALRSIGEYEEAADHLGVNVTLLKTIIFALSAFFMGAVGAIIATRLTYVDPYIAFNPSFSFMPVLMAIFGGMGSLYGPVIGAVIFAYLEETLLTRFPYYYMLLFGLILIAVILFLPNGLAGLIDRWKGGLAAKNANT